jgi:hypothetical protein
MAIAIVVIDRVGDQRAVGAAQRRAHLTAVGRELGFEDLGHRALRVEVPRPPPVAAVIQPLNLRVDLRADGCAEALEVGERYGRIIPSRVGDAVELVVDEPMISP